MAKIKITKNENWFKHDFRAREDKKLLKLKMKYKSSAPIGIFWQLVEMIYENEGEMELDIELLAFQLSESEDMIKDVIEQCFILSDEGLTHETIIEQLELRKENYEQVVQRNSKAGKASAEARKLQQLINNTPTHSSTDAQHIVNIIQPETETETETELETELEKELRDDSKSKININIVSKLLAELVVVDNPSDIEYVINDLDSIGWDNIYSAFNMDEREKENYKSLVIQKLNSITD